MPRIKINSADLLKGAGTSWLDIGKQLTAGQQVADMRKVNPQMSTRTRGGGYRQPGMSEGELADFEAQGNGEVVDLAGPNNISKDQAQKIGEQRTDGALPEQDAKPIGNRHERTTIDVPGATTQATPSPVDSYGKMLEFLKAQQQVDADADKRARRREMLAAIGDGISAISSLYQTTKGAPVTYTPGKDMSEVMRQRYDRLTSQRKADADKYLNYLKMQAARDNALIETQYKARRLAADEAREDRENRRLDETERHNRELEKYYNTKEQNSKDAKAAEQVRKDNDSAKKNEREEKKAEAYVAAQKKKGSSKSGKGSSKNTQSNTPPSRRTGNTNNNNVRPSQRK